MKASNPLRRLRVEQVAEILVAGGSFRDIWQYASEKDPSTGRPWRVSDRQLRRYVSMADELLSQRMENDRQKRFTLAIAQRQALYARAFEAGDWRAALSILKDRDELWGLYPSSITDMQEEVERLQKQVEELRHGQRKATSSTGQAGNHNGSGSSRVNGHGRPQPSGIPAEPVDRQ
jgi:hypothetical protein